MTAAAAEAMSRRLGAAVGDLSGAWYGRHMAAAERAIRARLPLVDLVLEVRDARVPNSSSFEPLRRRGPLEPDRRRVVLLNKADLADPTETEEWVAYIKKQTSCPCVAVNSHSRESIKELLNAVQTRIREINHGDNNCTGTALLVGIPNVGKSAIVNAMHQIGRISAAEKGKLKHAIVSSHPGETRDISGYKIASHPNIYVLDTPGVLSPRFANDGSGPRLALTGAIKDSLLEEYDILQFLLAIVNSGKEYRKWEKLNKAGDTFSDGNTITSRGHNNRGQYASDHTQDFVVKAVRQVLFESVSCFNGDLGQVDELRRLIGHQLVNLQEVFKVSTESRMQMDRIQTDITDTTRTPHLDGNHVVFGRAIKGMGVVRAMEHISVDEADRPTDDVVIVDCGELPEGANDGVINFFKDGDMYPDWPIDLDEKPAEISWWMDVVESAKAFGNESFKKQDYKTALRKYRKSMRYLDLCWEKEDIDEERSTALRKTKSIIFTNSSACKLKLGDLEGALLDADFALREREDNAKAFFRQGQVRMALNHIDAAVESFKQALQLEPNDGGIKRELAAAKKKISDRRDREKKAFSRLFQPSGGSEKGDKENS